MPLVALGAMAAGAALGAINGALVARLGLPAIVVTLATMVAWREGLRWATEGVWVQDLPAGFQWFGLGQDAGRWLVGIGAAAVWAVVAWVLGWTAGRPRRLRHRIRRRGGAPAGVRPPLRGRRRVRRDGRAHRPGGGALVGAVHRRAGQRRRRSRAAVIAAVVVGGTAVSGGRGTLAGTLAGVALLATLGPALAFLGAPAAWERALQGAIILIAVSAEGFRGAAAEGATCLTPRLPPPLALPLRRPAATSPRGLATPELVLLALLVGELVVVLPRRHQLLHVDNGLEILRRQHRGRSARPGADAGHPHRRDRSVVRLAARALGGRLRRDLARCRPAGRGRGGRRHRRRPARAARSTRCWSPASACRR